MLNTKPIVPDSKPTIKNGFTGLVARRFGGDANQARRWVAALGRASYFYGYRPGHAKNLLQEWAAIFPDFIKTNEAGDVIDINWKSPLMNGSATK